ncbi:cyclic lactone autoinducer peptide [Mediterraneibacter agrestimuris]|uniref:cyclic lactone autoinducer peptide n=1 Tax=Mediterraneibacter agrestimuris TaxID=2941333 RepID=UPI00203DBEC9|nr:cyclic lactone autoinducer peptide [Mediterraneibacter agrestimuris]
MKENKLLNNVAKGVGKVLNNVLKIEANTTSCVVVYQPKAPKKLEELRKEK